MKTMIDVYEKYSTVLTKPLICSFDLQKSAALEKLLQCTQNDSREEMHTVNHQVDGSKTAR